MASTPIKVTEIYKNITGSLSNYENWTAFLSSAAWQYKYSFDDQLLIYAQNPNARACATYEDWNNKLQRWVKKGSKGIALLREGVRGQYLDYVFDISDTGGRSGTEVYIWKYDDKYYEQIYEALKKEHGEFRYTPESIDDLVDCCIRNIAIDIKDDYLPDLKYSVKNSFMEGYEDAALGKNFLELLEASASYMVMKRMGIDPDNTLVYEDFENIYQFNTPEVLSVLGNAVNDTSEILLREISAIIREQELSARNIAKNFAENNFAVYNNEQTEEINNNLERDEENDSDKLHPDRRLPDAELSIGTNRTDRQIRDDETEISQRASQGSILGNENQRDSDESYIGDRQAGEGAGAGSDISNGDSSGSYGTDESRKSDEVGRTYEQPKARSRRRRSEYAGEQLSLFDAIPSEEEQKNIVQEAARIDFNKFDAAFSMSQEEIDAIFKRVYRDTKCKIYEYFTEGDASTEEKAKFLKNQFGNSGHSYTFLSGDKGFIDYTSKGISIKVYDDNDSERTLIKWNKAAKRIDELIFYDRYLTSEEKEYYPRYIEMKIEYKKRSEIGGEMIDIFREYNADKKYPDVLNNYLNVSAASEFILNKPLVHARLTEGESVSEVLSDAFDTILKNEPDKYGERIEAVLKRARPYMYIIQNKTLSGYERYKKLKEEYPDNIISIQIGNFFEFYEKDAELVAKLRNIHTTYKTISEGERVTICGIPDNILEDNIEAIRAEGHSVTINAIDEATGEYRTYTMQGVTDIPLPVYDRETEIISEVLSAIGKSDMQIEYDENGIVGINGDKRLHGSDFYKFLIQETLLDKNGINMLKLTDESFNDFKDLMFHYNMEDIWNEAGEILLGRAIEKPSDDTKSPKNTLEHRNYLMLKKLAPEILSNESSYMYFTAGEAIMPLSINYITDNRIAVSHFYFENGELIPDPDMEFVFDNEAETLTARTFQQGGFYQYAEREQGIDRALEKELNSFANMWFRNNEAYGFVKERQKAYWLDEEIELCFNETGEITSIIGTPETVLDYISVHNLNLTQLSQDTFGIVTNKETPELESELTENKVLPELLSENRHNFRITNDNIGHGTPTEKYEANVTAIRLLKQIEAENRLATPDEQEILSAYVGWGGLSKCFEEGNKHYDELKKLLTDEEYTSARESVLTSFYTPPVVIRAMYKALDNMGFKTGNILDAACGTGHFIGMLPENMSGSKMYGVEIDSISGRIARQLYQNSNIEIKGFEDTTLPESFFDVAVGNVPFGNYKVFDKKYDKYNFLIHDYFIAKTIDKVRPGGVIAYVTTNGISGGTMDKQSDNVRKYIAKRCDLIGAIRLPINTFLQNAGTKTNTDIIFLQKLPKERSIENNMPNWVDTSIYYENEYTDSNGNTAYHILPVNNYFIDNPDMVLGKLELINGPYGPQIVCQPDESVPFEQQINNAVENLRADIQEYSIDNIADEAAEFIPVDDDSIKNFSYTLVDGTVYYRENNLMYKVDTNKTAINRIKGLIKLRDCTRELIDLQLHDGTNAEVEYKQDELNRLYDDYVERFDRINSKGNEWAFSDDNSYYLLCSLEILDNKGNFERKADMFTKRTIRNYTPVQSVETAIEALQVSVSERACVDMGFMTRLSGKSFDELEEELKGQIFRNINCPTDASAFTLYDKELHRYPYVTADEYLSGDIRLKLKMAEAMREVQPEDKQELLDGYIKALREVMPKDLEAREIFVRLGTHWIPTEYYRQFIFELLDTPEIYKKDIDVIYSTATGDWHISGKYADTSDNVKAVVTYGTSRVNAYQLIEDCLRFKNTKIYDRIGENSVINKTETAAAQERQEVIKEAFKDWLWKDAERRDTLTKFYNETMNNIRPREYDGSYLNFVGMNPEIELLPHQKDAVARGIFGGNTLLAHCVGAGKTFEMANIAMQAKRLGLCQKSLFVVPNNLVGQWAAEFYNLYPAANLLVATKKDFETKNRKKFCARIATGDYDGIIIGHSQLVKIPVSIERQINLLQKEIDGISLGIALIKDRKKERFSVK